MGAVELLLVRHGESTGNVAAAAASAAGADEIDVGQRDADVPLSSTGEEQAQALGNALAALSADARPQSVWSSPYERALQTTRIALDSAGVDMEIRIDERLRDRELGVLDLLTMEGVKSRHPDEADRRQWLGKFYHRPSGGESWADLALRIRTLLADLDREEDGRRVLLVCHDAIILVFRYVCERLSEHEVLELTGSSSVHNVSLTRLSRADDGHRWVLEAFNDVRHLDAQNVDETRHPGESDVPR
jgi:broad specificity phosphatase PhoE